MQCGVGIDIDNNQWFAVNNISVVIVTGSSGNYKPAKTSVELLSSNGTRLCSLPDLPESRYYHSQSGLITCGGGVAQTKNSCVTFTGGRWKKTHTLGMRRHDHTAWASPRGVLIIGGGVEGSSLNTERLTDNGGATPSFALKNKRE